MRLGGTARLSVLAALLMAGGCESIDSLMPSFGSSSEPQAAAATPPPTAAVTVKPQPDLAPPPAPPPAKAPPSPSQARPAPALAVAYAGVPLTPGFDCNNAYWCLSVSPNGDVAIGNPGDRDGVLRPARKNVLAGQANRQPRSFVVKCVAPDLLPQDSHICRAMDSFGNVYGGNVRSPASPTFFRRVTAGPDPVAGVAALTPGFDCNDATWCLGVTPTGDVYIGNPNGYEGGMRPTGKNVLSGQSNRQPRSFTVRCVETGTLQDPFVCRANDSFGNSYAGNSKSPDNPKFFRAL